MAESDAALAALEDQRQEREDRLALAQRAQEEVEGRLDEKRAELERAEAEAALEAYESILRERALAADALASAVEAVATRLREYEAADAPVAGAWNVATAKRALLSKSSRAGLAPPEREPPRLSEAREMLVELVRPWLDRELERDLVEAAARSPMGHEIERLPEHLRALARERRGAMVRGSRGRASDG